MKNLSLRTRVYLIITYALGALILIPNALELRLSNPVMFILLCVLASALHILKVEGATNRSHYTFSFLVFGFAILHLDLPQALAVIVVTNMAEWVWNKTKWFIQPFNIACYVLSAWTAATIYSRINPAGTTTSWQVIVAIVLGMAGFTVINHFFVGMVVWLARGENFKQSGIFGSAPLLIDLIILTVGASLALVWQYNPYVLIAFLAPAYPLYMALKIPALERKTEIDQKTGLFNHQYFMTQFGNELQRANRYDRPLSVIIADLDLLRNINNTYGHLAGDEVLRGVADVLRSTVRDNDVVARFGGEEFAILMPETEVEKALQRAEEIRQAVQSARFVVPTSVEPIKATMSFGISKRENPEQSKEEILHSADTALYRSKLSGRNRSLAFVGESFLASDATGPVKVSVLPDTLTEGEAPAHGKDSPSYAAASTTYIRRSTDVERPPDPEAAAPEQSEKAEQTAPARKHTAPRSTTSLHLYVGSLVLAATLAATFFLGRYLATITAYTTADWAGVAGLAALIVLTEWFSISLYVRSTSLSTSAVPILALVIFFGPLGTVAASMIFAITAAIKFRSPPSRIFFNISNHIIAGLIINGIVGVLGSHIGTWHDPILELSLALLASLTLFVCTTSLVSVAIGIDIRQRAYEVWKEQYRWMAPYYLGIGFIAFALMFGYMHAGLLGILTMTIPLALLRLSQAQYVEHSRVTVNEIRRKNQELEKAAQEITAMNEGLLTTLSEIIDLRDPYVLGHSKQVSKYAAEIARRMGLSERQTELIRRAGLLHDIGKLGISLDILTKPAALTWEEYEIIKSHAALGSELVKNSPSLRPLVPLIRHHHENFNGTGYPDGIAGNDIALEARILAVADALDAMTSDRPYRKALRKSQVVAELKRQAGTQFDPRIAHEAIKIIEDVVADGDIALQSAEEPIALPFRVNLQTP